MFGSFEITVRPIEPADKPQALQFITEQWGEDLVVSRGVVHQPSALPGFIAEYDGRLAGLVTYRMAENSCEIITIDVTQKFGGVGTMLLDAVTETVQASGCRRLWLVTTNDNLPALRFYQRRGFVLVALYPNAIAESRKLKPGIPLRGIDGIPIRDEIELELDMGQTRGL